MATPKISLKAEKDPTPKSPEEETPKDLEEQEKEEQEEEEEEEENILPEGKVKLRATKFTIFNPYLNVRFSTESFSEPVELDGYNKAQIEAGLLEVSE